MGATFVPLMDEYLDQKEEQKERRKRFDSEFGLSPDLRTSSAETLPKTDYFVAKSLSRSSS